MYGSDMNAGLGISAGIVGISYLQSALLAVVVLFAIVSLVTAVRVIRKAGNVGS